MARQITGFADNCWEVREDGSVVRRAMDRSYKEHLLSGIPIEEIIDSKICSESVLQSPRVFKIWSTYWSTKPVRPIFLEPAVIKPLKCSRCRSILKKEWEWHTCLAWITCEDCGQEYQDDPIEDTHYCNHSVNPENCDANANADDIPAYYHDLSVIHNHRGKPKKASRRKQPKFITKAQKNASVLARGKIRREFDLPTNSFKALQEWQKIQDNYITTISFQLRWGEKQYRWCDVDSIIKRFETTLEPEDNVMKKWYIWSSMFLKEYMPIDRTIYHRYFDSLSWDDYESWDSDYRISMYY